MQFFLPTADLGATNPPSPDPSISSTVSGESQQPPPPGIDSLPAARQRGKSKRGFAAMSVEKQRELASLGGKAAHAKGTAHEFTPEEARSAGRRGGQATKNKKRTSVD